MKTIAQIIHQNKLPLEILDFKGNVNYYEDSDGYWVKRNFDSKRTVTYYENLYGIIAGKR